MEDKDTPEGDEKETAATAELGEAGKRALENERKARQAAEKRAKELEAKVKEAEDAEKTELEKLQGQVADLTKRAEGAELKAARYEVAADKGLSPAQARRLAGATKEELEADADAMRSELGLDKDKDEDKPDEELPQDEQPLGRPKEELKGGASPAGEQEVDASKLAASILAEPW